MAFTRPDVDDFKARFVRDFPYTSAGDYTGVTDADIETALSDADFDFPESLFDTQAMFNLGFLLMTAHTLVMNLRASSQGINGQYSWLQTSKSVGSVSESLQIPQRIADNPYMAMLTKTNYGARYLELILPQLCGQVLTIGGATQP